MTQDNTPESKNCAPGTPGREKLFLVGGRYSTVHYPDRVSIIEIRDSQQRFGNVHPLTSIPVARTMDDADACILALNWLRDNNYITAAEYARHETDCMTASSRGQLRVLRHNEWERMMAKGA